jgi:hypothetical protein
MDEEELHWFKRSHETWLLKGDNNTEFFHRVANGKKRKQTFFSLMGGDIQVVGTDDLLRHALDFYKALFGPGCGDAFDLDPELWFPEDRVIDEENLDLTKEFCEEEIRKAMF